MRPLTRWQVWAVSSWAAVSDRVRLCGHGAHGSWVHAREGRAGHVVSERLFFLGPSHLLSRAAAHVPSLWELGAQLAAVRLILGAVESRDCPLLLNNRHLTKTDSLSY